MLAGLVAGCGSSSSRPAPAKQVDGNGFAFGVPAGWKVERSYRSVTARSGQALVSVTVFRLSRSYRPQLWDSVVPELDRVAGRLATAEHARLASSRTTTIAGGRAREYELERDGVKERIAFVLSGKREYQLFCKGTVGDACSLLESSFELRTPTAGDLASPTS